MLPGPSKVCSNRPCMTSQLAESVRLDPHSRMIDAAWRLSIVSVVASLVLPILSFLPACSMPDGTLAVAFRMACSFLGFFGGAASFMMAWAHQLARAQPSRKRE